MFNLGKRLYSAAANMNEGSIARARDLMDRRKPFIIAIDDYAIEKRGKKVWSTSKVHDSVSKRPVWGHNIVDAHITNGDLRYYHCFEVYVPKQWFKGRKTEFRNKNRIARDFARRAVADLRQAGAKNKVWTVLDSWYASKENIACFRELGVYYAQAIKCDAKVVLKSGNLRIDKYFEQRPSKYRTIRGKGVEIKDSYINLNAFGQHRVIAFRDISYEKWTFIITNARKSKVVTVIKRYFDRWNTEPGHRELKQECGITRKYLRKKSSLLAQFSLAYSMFNKLSFAKARKNKQNRGYTLGELVTSVLVAADERIGRTSMWEGMWGAYT